MSTGEPNSHFQSLALNYKLPFQYIPFLSFIDATYNYTGNFNWQRGSEALAGVTSEDGIALGLVNTIQNNNTKTITGALSFSRLYSALGLETTKNRFKSKIVNSQDKDSVKKNTIFKKSLTKVVDFLTAIKRVQASYNENNGSVLPGYLPSVGFAGGLKPTLGYTLGSQADIRYEVARQGWLTGFPNFNQLYTQLRSSKFKISAQVVPLKGLLIDFNAERDFTENQLENFRVEDQDYLPQNTSILGNFGMSTVLLKTAFNQSKSSESTNFN